MDDIKKNKSLRTELYLSVLTAFGLSIALYISSAMITRALFLRKLCSDRLEYDQLEQIVTKEKSAIGLEKNVAVFIRADAETSSSICYTENDCEITIKYGHAATMALRHELYHIAKHGAAREPLFTIKSLNVGYYPLFFFYQEPAANVYALTGLKF